jgi:hypothetical protein
MEHIVLKPENFNTDNLNIGEVKDIPNVPGAKMAYLNYNDEDIKKQLYIQTPLMSAPFGLSKFQSKNKDGSDSNEAPKYSLDLSFLGKEKDDKIKNFHTLFKSIDKIVKKHGTGLNKNGKWMKKKYDKKMIEEFYASNIKVPEDNADGTPSKFDPTFKIKVPTTKEGVINIKMYDKDKKEMDGNPEEIITKGCKAKALIRVKSIWLNDKRFGLSIELVQVIVHPSSKMNTYGFADSDDENASDEENDKNEEQESDDEEEDNNEDNDGDNNQDEVVEENDDE